MLINPLGKTLEHFFLVEVDWVPFPYGAPVDTGIGTTVAVLMMTTGALDETAPCTPPMEETPAEFAAAVSVYTQLVTISLARKMQDIPQ